MNYIFVNDIKKLKVMLCNNILETTVIRPHACNFSFMVILCAKIKMRDALITHYFPKYC